MKASLLARVASTLLLGGVLAGGIAFPSHAQTASSGTAPPAASNPTPPPASSSTSMSHASTATHHQKTAATAQPMQQMVDQRIAELHSKLHITKQQEPQWQQFTQLMRDNATQVDTAYQQRADKLSSMTAVENMQSYAEIEQSRAQDVQKLVPAFQSLYAALSDQQKKQADEMFRTRAETAQVHRQAAR